MVFLHRRKKTRRLPSGDAREDQAKRLPLWLGVMIALDVILLGLVVYVLWRQPVVVPPPTSLPSPSASAPSPTPTEVGVPSTTSPAFPSTPNEPSEPEPVSTVMPDVRLPFFEGPITYGYSVEGRPLIAYRLGTGSSARAIVGGIHGGYEWNTVHLVSRTLEYFRVHTSEIPVSVTLYIIPCANPDGYARSFDLDGRVNARGVDLNRNWNYNWQMTATHGTRPVFAGRGPFSEPETAALRDFILAHGIEAVIFYHSAMGKIFSGAERDRCPTYELAEMLSGVTGYLHAPEGVPGQITTGDAIDWLSLEGIPAVEIELTTHQDLEFERNLRGIIAFLNWTIPESASVTLGQPREYAGECMTYTVQPGDTLSQIALKYGLSVEELAYVNGMSDADVLWAGETICIPLQEDR